jgi:AcrR family transcriptional regulator
MAAQATDNTPEMALHWPDDGGPAFLRGEDPRSRLLAAMAIAVSMQGYDRTTVADVVRIAHASRRTFYEHFEDRADCFLALGDDLNQYLLAVVARAAEPAAEDWRTQIERALDAYLETVASNPGLTRAFLLEQFAMGERGLTHRRRSMDRWVEQMGDLAARLRAAHPELNEISPQTGTAIAAGIWELSLLAAQEDRPDDIRRIRDVAAQLMADVLTAPRSQRA